MRLVESGPPCDPKRAVAGATTGAETVPFGVFPGSFPVFLLDAVVQHVHAEGKAGPVDGLHVRERRERLAGAEVLRVGDQELDRVWLFPAEMDLAWLDEHAFADEPERGFLRRTPLVPAEASAGE